MKIIILNQQMKNKIKFKSSVEIKNVLMEEFQELTTQFGESKLDNVLITNIITNVIKIFQ